MVPEICCRVAVLSIVVCVGCPRTGSVIQSMKRGSDVGQRMASCDCGVEDRLWLRAG